MGVIMSTGKVQRIILFDIVRGAAIIGVIFYHFVFDLRLLEFIETDISNHLGWFIFARVLSGSFLVLSGVGLVFAHHGGMRWRAFFKRFFVIGIAALGITLVTFLTYKEIFVYFGILHAIAIFSLLALPFLRAPLWLLSAVILFVLSLPMFIRNPIFNEKIFSWIGLWDTPPMTGDLVPIFPAFGLVLVGVLAARILLKYNLVGWLASFSPVGAWVKFLVKAGRWSLIIFLIHQPILLGILTPIAMVVNTRVKTEQSELSKQEAFYGACFGNCIETGGAANYCASYCQCSLEQVEQGDLWAVINSPLLDKEQSEAVVSILNLCVAMSGK